MPKVTRKGIPSVPIPHLYCITRFSLHLGVLWDKGAVLGASCQEVWFIKGLNGQGVPRGPVSQLQCWQPKKHTHTHTHTPWGLGPALGLGLQFSYDFRKGHRATKERLWRLRSTQGNTLEFICSTSAPGYQKHEVGPCLHLWYLRLKTSCALSRQSQP